MLHAIDSAPSGAWPRERAIAHLTADFESRGRRRMRLRCDDGRDLLLDLERARALRDGDGLRVADGGWVAVHAAAEPLIEVRCKGAGQLARIAWHIGNRHCPAEIHEDRILIRDDHVLADMLRGLGATVTVCQRPFHPEGGAYADHQGHGHDHSG